LRSFKIFFTASDAAVDKLMVRALASVKIFVSSSCSMVFSFWSEVGKYYQIRGGLSTQKSWTDRFTSVGDFS
jgi:hypothetical protein